MSVCIRNNKGYNPLGSGYFGIRFGCAACKTAKRRRRPSGHGTPVVSHYAIKPLGGGVCAGRLNFVAATCSAHCDTLMLTNGPNGLLQQATGNGPLATGARVCSRSGDKRISKYFSVAKRGIRHFYEGVTQWSWLVWSPLQFILLT